MNIQTLYGTPETRSGLFESPVWDDQTQCFYWIDIPKRQLHRHELNDTHTIWQLPQTAEFDPGAIALTDQGRICIALRSGIAFFEPNTPAGEIEPQVVISAPYNTDELRFNDGGVDAAGRFWIGSLFAPKTRAGASLFCLEKGVLSAVVGEHSVLHQDWGVTTSNGWATSPDSALMYHSDTQAHAIYHYDYAINKAPTESVSNRQEFYKTPNQAESAAQNIAYQGRPDGAAVDSAGNYWSAQFEGGQVIQFSPSGEILQRVMIPAKCPTMLCFGGADLKTLIITTAGSRPEEELANFPANGYILKIDADVAGLPSKRYIEN